jgi:anthranilate synthase component 2
MVLLIDNYDSFTYNLYQYIGQFEKDIKVVRNDEITIEQIEELNPHKIIISPGPKSPDEAGICVEVIRHFWEKKPILGICLGHQCIGKAFGAVITYAKELYHGKYSVVTHTGASIFNGLSETFQAARYHSLVIRLDTIPDELEIIATTEDKEVMAVKHKKYPVIGLQFHPESIYTPDGIKIIENFLEGV